MVCQAASQTRFRALKYENGIEGGRSGWMEPRDSGSLFPQLEFDQQSRASDSFVSTYPWAHGAFPAGMSSGVDIISASRAFPFDGMPLRSCIDGGSNELHGMFHGLPRFCPGHVTASLPGTKQAHLRSSYQHHEASAVPNLGSEGAHRRFLVFDHSGDQTTLIYSSRMGVECGVKQPDASVFYRDPPLQASNRIDLNGGLGQTNANEFDVNSGPDIQSEMREDTEELNALLYSDDESDCSEDDEVTSTGHSPSTMTFHDKQHMWEGSMGGVNSVNKLSKRRRLCDDCKEQVLDTATSVKRYDIGHEYQDDAESSCGSGEGPDSGSRPSNKRIQRERIRETVSLLRSIVPCGEEKDPTIILDEAIDYLKSLKQRATSLGIHSL